MKPTSTTEDIENHVEDPTHVEISDHSEEGNKITAVTGYKEEPKSSSWRTWLILVTMIVVVTATVVLCIEFIPDKKDDNDTTSSMCDIPPYEHLLVPASCADLRGDTKHTNSYWENEDFVCRLNERPCDATPSVENSFIVNLAEDDEYIDLYYLPAFTPGGDGEVWVAIANTNETACFALRAEGHWCLFGSLEALDLPTTCDGSDGQWCESVLVSPYISGNVAPSFHDYEFDSLRCCDGSKVYIIIDGVLVDSCPKDVAEQCRHCNVQ
jgi:hypothetical protein